jgi:hypothetical protein
MFNCGLVNPLNDLTTMNNLPFTGGNSNAAPVFSTADYNVFDTLSLTHRFPNSQPLDYKKIFRFNRRIGAWLAKTANGRITVSFRFSRNGRLIITATFSILNLFYGDNLFAEISKSDIENAFEIVSEEVTNLIGFGFDAPASKVTRTDGNRDFSTTRKHEYLAALGNHHIAHTEIIRYPVDAPLLPTTGYEFVNQGKRIKIYDKFAHLNDKHPELPAYKRQFAETFLRVEPRLFRHGLQKYVFDFFGSKNRTASKILIPEFAAYIVGKTLLDLDLTRDIPTFEEYKQTILEKFPKQKQAYDLIRFAETIHKGGLISAKAEYGRNFKYRKKKLTEAGVWRTFFAPHSTLPALSKQPNDDWRMYYDDESYFA